MVTETAQNRVDSLRQKISARRAHADSLFAAYEATPARETTSRELPLGRAFSFAASIHNDNNVQLAADKKLKLKSIMDSLNEKKQIAYANTPEPVLADTGSLKPSPEGLPNVVASALRIKNSVLSQG